MIEARFEGPEGSRRYEICMQALLLSKPEIGGRQVQVSEWDDMVGLLRALKPIGIPVKQQGLTLYNLKDEGGVAKLDRAERNLLVLFLKQPIWRPETIEDVQETIKWLDELQNITPRLENA